MVDVVLLLPRHAELAKVAAPPDRHNHALGADPLAVIGHDGQMIAGALDAVGLGGTYRNVARLRLQFIDERLLYRRRHLEVAGRLHLLRIGVDGLARLEVFDRSKRAVSLQDGVREAVPLRLAGRRHPRCPGP